MAYLIALLIFLAVLGTIYFVFVRPHLLDATWIMDKPYLIQQAPTFIARVDAKLLGLKTVILAFIAAAVQGVSNVLPDLLSAATGAHWETVVDQRVANWITLLCVMLIPVTHARGLGQAAKATPADPTDQG